MILVHNFWLFWFIFFDDFDPSFLVSILTSRGFQLHEGHVTSPNQVEEDKYVNSVKRNAISVGDILLLKCQLKKNWAPNFSIQCWPVQMISSNSLVLKSLNKKLYSFGPTLMQGSLFFLKWNTRTRCNRIYLVFPVLCQSSWAIDRVCAGPSVALSTTPMPRKSNKVFAFCFFVRFIPDKCLFTVKEYELESDLRRLKRQNSWKSTGEDGWVFKT